MSVTSFHETAVSLNQHMSSENSGELFKVLPETLSTDVKLKHIPKWYKEVPPMHLPCFSIPESRQPVMIVTISPPELPEDQD